MCESLSPGNWGDHHQCEPDDEVRARKCCDPQDRANSLLCAS